MYYNNELYHYGVKGMKWGVHRSRLSSFFSLGKKRKVSSRKGNVKSNVKQYSKLYDKASSMSDRADAKTRGAKALYKKTGKNFVSRVINNLKSEQSAAVKKYQQTMNTAGKMTDEANTAWSAAKSAYKKTGKTYVTRIINNIKYS